MRQFLLLLLASLAITGCGQKGPLYKSSSAEVVQPKKLKVPKSVSAEPEQVAETPSTTEKTQ